MVRRYLTKSRFTLAHTCNTKLFYTNKPEYANSNQDDGFLASLAEGGKVVGELAKLYFPGGYTVTHQNDEQALLETNQLLLQDHAIIFEAAVAVENLFCRIDVLVKRGREVKLIEVKSKSIDANADDPFRGRHGGISSEWKKYLLDVAFQRLVLRDAFPEYLVSSWLMCVDKTQECTVDGLYQLFQMEKDGFRSSCRYIGNPQKDSICPQILKKFGVDQHIDELYRCRDDYGGRSFEDYVRWLANHYTSDTRIPPKIGVHCKNCEFRCTQTQRDEGFRDGFRECWSHELKWTETDFERPTIFDLYDFRPKSQLIDERRIALDDLTEEDIGTDTDDEPGLHPKKMQCVRLAFLKSDRDGFFFDADGFREVKRNWQFPLHFIDFETAAPPVPLHRRLRPYQSLAFQFSHHVLYEDGKIEHAGQYLNTDYGAYPNFDFLRNLMASLEVHPGTIFRYASHENTILNHIKNITCHPPI